MKFRFLDTFSIFDNFSGTKHTQSHVKDKNTNVRNSILSRSYATKRTNNVKTIFSRTLVWRIWLRFDKRARTLNRKLNIPFLRFKCFNFKMCFLTFFCAIVNLCQVINYSSRWKDWNDFSLRIFLCHFIYVFPTMNIRLSLLCLLCEMNDHQFLILCRPCLLATTTHSNFTSFQLTITKTTTTIIFFSFLFSIYFVPRNCCRNFSFIVDKSKKKINYIKFSEKKTISLIS